MIFQDDKTVRTHAQALVRESPGRRRQSDPRYRVLLIEAGGRDNYPWIHIPVGFRYCLGNPRTDWCFKSEPEPGLAGRVLAFPRGLGLGGTSSINGMIYVRGQALDYDGWRAAGNVGWGWEDVLPHFIRLEDYHAGADGEHGAGAEMRVERQRVSWKVTDNIGAAFQELGVPNIRDFNRGDNFGAGLFEANQRRGLRWSAARAFLSPVRRRPNLNVMTHALARRLVVSRGRVTGVKLSFSDGREAAIVHADGEVILAAGSIGSPQLLQLSGIGPGHVLSTAGVEVLHDLPGIGENLQDHFQVRTLFHIENAETLNDQTRTLMGKARIAAEYPLRRSGPVAMAACPFGAFVKSDNALDRADALFHVQPFSFDTLGDPLHPFPALTMSGCQLRPLSRGHVRIKTPNAKDHPKIVPHFLSAPADVDAAVRIVKFARRVMAAKAMVRHAPVEFGLGREAKTDDEIAALARQTGSTIHHAAGTCKMGSDALGVVDARLKVRGLDGLRIADASVMPFLTSGNTKAPAIMIGEKASVMLVEDRSTWSPARLIGIGIVLARILSDRAGRNHGLGAAFSRPMSQRRS